jgi:surfeit locus 1 family protein
LSRSRLGLFVAIAILIAAGCARLGVWQLRRLHERQSRNALVRSRLDSAEVDITAIPRDSAHARFRRARVVGEPDYEHELVLASRTHGGSPGVYLITPVRIPGRDSAVIVNRGWVYSPDGSTVDLSKWHDRDSVFTGYVDDLPVSGGGSFTNRPRVLTRLTASSLAGVLPYPVAGVYLVVLGDSTPAADRPARLGVPPLDDGPHMGYAVQWFAFALIALIGTGIAIASSRRESRGAEDA